ncbi:MAG TPA: glycosyltransferase [Vicinamibacterales bacterium]|nr:glycosyltransferase [Vicinamibacterales bacterium]
MARIVITAWGSYGDVYPFIGLALALGDRGHQPVLAMPALYRDMVERERLQFMPVRPDLSIHDRELAARIMDPASGPQVLFGEVIIPALRHAHADLMDATAGADLLITHPATPAGPIVAEERGMRWASAVLAPMSFFSVTDPVVPPPAPWIQPWLARSPLLSRTFLWVTHRITQGWAEPIQQFRLARGLARGENPILAGQHSPHLVLALFSTVLARPQSDWPRNVCLAGPSLYNGPDNAALPEGVARFLAKGPPPIVFTLGTSAVMAAGRFYETSAQVARELQQRAVLLVGPHAQNWPPHVGPHVHVADFAPHATLFPRAAVVVHQGGAGTLHQALVSGRPMLVVPHSHDQPDNAARVTRLGVARTVYPRRYTVSRVARELRALLEPHYAKRAGEVAAIVRAEDGPQRAADEIERLLRQAAHTKS